MVKGIVQVEKQPRMEEIAQRARQALESTRLHYQDKERIELIRRFHHYSMEDIIYLLKKLDIEV